MDINCQPLEVLERMRISKGDLPGLMGIKDKCFDYALPQDWLNDFVKRHKLNYDVVLSTTFMLYDGRWTGPVTGCLEVSRYLDDDYRDVKDLMPVPEYRCKAVA
jgi:hypothetical protein